MIFIIGGAYQGKLDFAKNILGITDADVFFCEGGDVDFTKRCICSLEKFAANCTDPVTFFEENREKWRDSVLIMRDISCGVVPMGAEDRSSIRHAGKLAQYLGERAERVSRIFCGLELRLK